MRTIHFPLADSQPAGAADPGTTSGVGGWPTAPFMDPMNIDFQFMFNPEADHNIFATHETDHQHPPPHHQPNQHHPTHYPAINQQQAPHQVPPPQPQLQSSREEEGDEEDPDPENPSATYYPSKPAKKTPPQVDPFAAGFLREVLGAEKWNTFSSRLFERRLVGPRARQKTKGKAVGGKESEGRDNQFSASVIDFLTKAEAVKEVLRTYVPHPYNPHKTLSHPYLPAPSGRVTLSRSTVLALSGWSNTQFSYWARRSEAISVLGIHDRRLRAVAIALSHRLRGEPLENETESVNGITGKGLDAIVEEVKDRTGASQFLRGKHSSLDPFGLNDAMTGDVDHRSLHTSPVTIDPAPAHYVSTFDSHGYGPTTTANYFSPALSDARSMSPEHQHLHSSTSTMAASQQLPQHRAIHPGIPPQASSPYAHQPLGFPAPAAGSVVALPENPTPPMPPPAGGARASNRYPSRAKRASGTTATQANTSTTNSANGSKAMKSDSSRREYFPVSDSRSEVEAGRGDGPAPAPAAPASGKRKAGGGNGSEGPSKKRSKNSDA